MSKLWKDLKVNFMYWRFRNITRNRLRLQSWWASRRGRSGASPVYRPRASALHYPRSSTRTRRSWIALLVMIALLTAVSVAGKQGAIPPGIGWAVDALVVVGCLYWAMRGT
jgi:hypothetical protein